MADETRPSAATYSWAQWFFLRSLAVIYLFAFLSFWVQAQGLIGSHGILPLKDFLQQAGEVLGGQRFRIVPTLFWLNSGDTMLHVLCGAGVVLSAALVFGVAPAPVLFFLWALYLSLCSAGQDFMQFQWDILLLETGFLAIFIAPPIRRHTRESPPNRIAIWMLRWLLFRLMFSSGVIELASGDPTWRNLSALRYHFETQPLPTWIGWFFHLLPDWFLTFSCGAMLAVELAAPFLTFGPPKTRRIGFWLLAGLQVVIFITGNYCFFNLLSIALCLLLLDDEAFPFCKLRRKIDPELRAAESSAIAKIWPIWITRCVLAFLFLLSLVHLAVTIRLPIPWPQSIATLYNVTAPFRTVNGYGLFAVMTTERLEIVVEGSRDGTNWQPYEFKYKPGDPKRRPRFVEPHQPRLDWQMWFAALGTYQQNQWFILFCERLLSGEKSVTSLLAYNPFPDRPPAYIRARLARYHFSDFNTWRKTGEWWTREPVGEYLPVIPQYSIASPDAVQPGQ